MRAGLASLVAAYVLSQFYRAFLAVLAPVLAHDISAMPEDLAAASGYWFLAFALMQLPVGWALDHVGPRFTTAGLMALAALGSAVFALADGPGLVKIAMALIGMGCAPVLMASYYIFARTYAPVVFGTLAGAMVGIGNLGNIAASVPMSLAAEALGWRGALWGLAAVTLAVALAILVFVRDPGRLGGERRGSLLDLLRMRAFWPVLLMMAACYAPAAGLRGLWIGPYFAEVYSADAARIGTVSLIMGLAMVAGNFAYGPLDRLLGTRKWVVFGGNLALVACLLLLWRFPAQGGWLPVALFAGVGIFGSTYPMVMAHGRAFLPPHLVGRGVTLLNLFGLGTTGIMQIVTGRLHAAFRGPPPETPYAALFIFYAGLVLAGLLIYALSEDRSS
ncbi:MFS transporter [bacterium]|nr:MFS transporter [bacterium]